MANRQNLTHHENTGNFFKLKPLSACIRAVITGYVIMGSVLPVQAELPIASPVWVGSGSASREVVGNNLNIYQQTERATLNWDRFNVSSDSAVNFKQPSVGSIALNRISDGNPSQILGTVTANGQIYLVNKNGFVFGKDSVVNTRGLVASTLDVTKQAFETGITKVYDSDRSAAFQGSGDFYQKNKDGSFKLGADGQKIKITIDIKSGAQIKSAQGGRILVLAPTILNSGNVESSGGQVVMAAATDKVYLQEAPITGAGSDVRGLLVEVETGGKVENLGAISANHGNVTLMGFAVNQKGKVSATTTTNLNGTIRLLAREGEKKEDLPGGMVGLRPDSTTRPVDKGDGLGLSAKVTLGTGSTTEILPEIEYLPVEQTLASGEKITESVEKTAIDKQTQPQSRVEIMANKVHLQAGSEIAAPSGKVEITATAKPDIPLADNIDKNSSSILIDSGAKIDVSGLDTAVKAMESNIIEVELRNFELKDAPLQKTGLLKNKTILVDVREGTPLTDIQPLVDGIRRKISERMVDGGEISLKSEGEAFVEKGSVLDFSGGAVTYLDGVITTTKLVSNGRLIDIKDADPLLTYDAIYGEVIKKYEKWGITKTWSIEGPFALGRFERGYTEGHDAGSIAVWGHDFILDGELLGHAINGRRQRSLADQAAGGKLEVNYRFLSTNTIQAQQALVFSGLETGYADLHQAVADELRKGKVIAKIDAQLPSGEEGLSLPPLVLPAGKLINSGIKDASFSMNGDIIIADDAKIKLVEGGSLTLAGSAIDVLGDIEGSGATVNLSGSDITVGEGVSIRLQGEWINDFVNPANLEDNSLVPLAINGGKFVAKAGGEINLKTGSLIDVSGGAWLETERNLAAGSAGDIELSAKSTFDNVSFNVVMDGVLNAYGLEKGGRFKAGANAVVIRREDLQTGSERLQPLQLSSDFFTKGGFAEYDISSFRDGLTVEEDVNLNLRQSNRVLDKSFLTRANAPDLGEFAHIAQLLPEQRAASSLMLRADHSAGENANSHLAVGANAVINADDLSTVKLESDSSLFFDGEIIAPSGDVTLTITPYRKRDSETLDPQFQASQGIWLGNTAKIDVSGSSRVLVDGLGHRAGDVFDGGTVTVDAQRGFFASQAGSLINVSGTEAMLDLPRKDQDSIGVRYNAASIGSDAGAIDVTTAEGIFIEGRMLAKAGQASGTQGGKLSMTFNTEKRSEPAEISTFPATPRTLILSQGKNPVFSSPFKEAGDALPDEFNGKGFLAATQLVEGGFSSLNIAAIGERDEIRFQDNVSLQLDNTISLSAVKFGWESKTAATTGNALLNAATVSIGFDSLLEKTKIDPSDGGGQLAINADLIDLVGTSVTTGFNSVNLVSNGDIRLKGTRITSDELRFSGQFKTFSKLNLTADQVYPASYTAFTLAVSGDPSGTVTFSQGEDLKPVLAALGKLTVQAPNILQEGTINAPMGEIVLDAANTIKFGADSITSVSADGRIIPLGVTQGGLEWLVPIGSSGGPVLESPQKKITVKADKILRDEGALVDLSGGGDLLAYEFIPGSGGSLDILDTNQSFAVLPDFSNYAPFDFRETPKSGLKTGDSIYISGGSGLAQGVYALLPARYALLPGAFLVTPQSASGHVIPGSARTRIDGVAIVSGYHTVAGTGIRDQLWSEFVIEPGSIAKTRSEYNINLASSFFADRADNLGLAVPRLTQDGGQVIFDAELQLDLPTVRAEGINGGRGGLADIVAEKLSVVKEKTGKPDSGVELRASDIDKLKVESLLLGAVRSTDGKTGNIKLDVQAKEVRIAEDTAVKAPELMLAASDKVELKKGSRVQADGAVSDLDAGSVLEVAGDGALLRVSAGKQATLKRTGSTGSKGDLLVNEGAEIAAGSGSVLLESTNNSALDGELELQGGSLSLGAQAINLGEVSGVVTKGLSLDNSQLNKLILKELVLTSRSTVNLYGQLAKTDVNGNLVPVEFGNLVIDAAGLSGWQNAGKTALLNAGNVTFINNTGVTGIAGNGSGTLNINAEHMVLDKGNYQMSGFNQVNLNLSGSLTGRDAGQLTALGNVNITTPFVSADNGAKSTINATGHQLVLNQASQNLMATSQGIGAQLKLIADNIAVNTTLLYKTGHVSINALQGNVSLGSTALIDVSGAVANAGLSKPVNLSAGKISLSSQKQNVIAHANSKLLLKGINPDMPAGLLSVQAGKGQVQMYGFIDAHGAGKSNGGSIVMDTGSLTTSGFNGLNSLFANAGFTGGIDLRLHNGDIIIDAGQTVSANTINMTADTGKIKVGGLLDARGVNGGTVKLAAEDALTLDAGAAILAGAQGLDGNGGNVILSSIELNGDGAGIEIKNGARIDVAGAGNGEEGEVQLRADRLDTDNDGVQDINIKSIAQGAITGDSNVTVEAARIYNDVDGSITLADQSGYHTANQSYMNGLEAKNVAKTRFAGGFTIIPGVEVRSTGNLTLDAAWDLVSWRYGPAKVPGVLTLRAKQDLLINKNLSDAFKQQIIDLREFRVSGLTQATVNDYLQTGASWSYNLVAGADLTAADSLAVVTNLGDLKLASDVKVRTGTGDIDIRAGRDIVYGTNLDGTKNSVIYTAGRPDTANRYGFDAATALGFFYAEYPLDGGDINLSAGRDILGKQTTQLVSEWLVRTGNWGSGDNHAGQRPTAWGIAFGESNADAVPANALVHQQSLAALGGGNVTISAGENIKNLSVVIPTTGKQVGKKGTVNPLVLNYLNNEVEINGGGNLQLNAGGDIAGGVFHVDGGTADLYAAGSFKDGDNQGLNPLLAMGDSQFTITAGKDIALEAIIDPMIIPQIQRAEGVGIRGYSQFFRYSPDSDVKLTSLSGAITLKNDSNALNKATLDRSNRVTTNNNINIAADLRTVQVYPATLKAYALNGDINFGTLNLYPSAESDLELFAASNITGRTINQSDADPDLMPSWKLPATGSDFTALKEAMNRLDSTQNNAELIHATTPVHANDKNPVPVLISTGSGNIGNRGGTLQFSFAKPAEVKAGKDILDTSFTIQHNTNDDNTIIQADRDIKFATPINPTTGQLVAIEQSIEIAGPGQLTLLAGRNFSLGVSKGIKSIGNTFNSALADDGASITAIAGLAGGQINATGFAEKFLASTDKYAPENQHYLEQFVKEMRLLTGNRNLTAEAAKAAFNSISDTEKAQVEVKLLASVQQVYFKELKLAGAKGASATTRQGQDQAELELLEAIETLFPGTTLLSGNNDFTVPDRTASGNISMPFSTIQTVDGGDVNLMVPNGGLVAGLPTSIVIEGKDSGNLGIIAKKIGDINVVVRDDFDVNTGRATTLGGGNVLGVSTEEDIDAGRTPKSQLTAPVTTVTYDNDGFPVIEVSPAQSGGGISANSPPGVPDGDVDLFAFQGIIDAGEAGIAGNNVTLGATAIVGADNIDIGGVSVGVPVAPTGSIAAGLTGVSNLAASVTNAIESTTNIGEETNKKITDTAALGVLSVDFLGFGE